MSFKTYQRRAGWADDSDLSAERLNRRKYDRHRTDVNREFVRNEMRKRGGCESCGLVDALELYEWHHIDDTDANKMPISQMVTRRSQHRIYEEMSKCVMLCPNCHNKYHQDLLCMIDHKDRPDLIPFTHVDGLYYTDNQVIATPKPNPLEALFENDC